MKLQKVQEPGCQTRPWKYVHEINYSKEEKQIFISKTIIRVSFKIKSTNRSSKSNANIIHLDITSDIALILLVEVELIRLIFFHKKRRRGNEKRKTQNQRQESTQRSSYTQNLEVTNFILYWSLMISILYERQPQVCLITSQ